MRTLVLQEFVTLDGLAAGPGDTVDFIPGSTAGDESFGRQQLAFLQVIDTILLGRATYQMFAAFWPDVAAGSEKAFADLLNSIPKMVFSQTLDRAPWGKWDEANARAIDPIHKIVRSLHNMICVRT
jgi:dihydrofolate reductase